MLTRELLARLPKAELHVHLDSAIRPATMLELARQAKFTLPTSDPDALRRFMRVDNAHSLEDYLARFEYTIPLLQSVTTLVHVNGLAYQAWQNGWVRSRVSTAATVISRCSRSQAAAFPGFCWAPCSVRRRSRNVIHTVRCLQRVHAYAA